MVEKLAMLTFLQESCLAARCRMGVVQTLASQREDGLGGRAFGPSRACLWRCVVCVCIAALLKSLQDQVQEEFAESFHPPLRARGATKDPWEHYSLSCRVSRVK